MGTPALLMPHAVEFDLFAGLTAEQLFDLTHGLNLISVAAGDVLDLADCGAGSGILWNGRLTLGFPTDSGGQRTISLIEEGDLLVPPTPMSVKIGRDLRCVALVPSVVAILGPEDLARWLAVSPMAENFVRVLTSQVADRELAVAIALEGTVERRLLLKLRQLALRWGRVTPQGVRLDLRLTHRELADMVGAVRESVTLAFGRLTRQGQIEVSGRTILIPTGHMSDQAPADLPPA